MEAVSERAHDEPLLRVSKQASVATICFNRPAKLNALTAEMSRDFLQAIRNLGDDPDVRVVILTGAGRAFCVGGDLTLEESFTALTFQRELELFADTVMAILASPKPFICQMNGDAVGWGATIALFCDMVIARDGARLGDPHVNVGLSTGDGASVIWPQLAGYLRAKQFLLTGDLMEAAEAARYGLVNEVVAADDLAARVGEIAGKIASKPALAVAMTKASVNIPLKDLVRSGMDTYIAYELATQQHSDHRVAVDGFMSRRSGIGTSGTPSVKSESRKEMVMEGKRYPNGIWAEEYGQPGETLLLIHGLGANGASWDAFLATAVREWKGRILIPDLRGHGRSHAGGNYSFGTMAADLAEILAPGEKVSIIGHSLGGLLGGLLATGWFGVAVERLLALSVKVRWSEQEIQKGREIAAIPPRTLPTLEQAMDRYLKIAGLAGHADTARRSAEIGVTEDGGQYRIAADQRIFGCASMGVPTILQSTQCPCVLGTGEKDPIAPIADFTEMGLDATVVAGAGHYPQIDAPDAVWDLFSRSA